ncbi:PAP2-domain-containing protein [Russula earlei]|uniref:PAP2-domain-containing protein n=1 Tax=Russula earlei TaxID=71964 RepID=A0ACC0U6U0_9AGAM|nr:PAP2-domain-containing protein [Russula earlei]
MPPRSSLVLAGNRLYAAFHAAVARMDKSLNPRDTIRRLQTHSFSLSDLVYLIHVFNSAFWLVIMQVPGFPVKLLIPVIHIGLLLVPLTSQFFLPALPVTTYLITFYSSQFIPNNRRPSIYVSLLPTLESVLFGANISDLLTRYTHPILDVIAWLPYGVGHFTVPFIVAIFLWLFRPRQALHLWGRAFGWMNFVGVVTQIIFPCAAPWYEVIFGLTPAEYSMKGSPGGLLRIDNLLHGHGYTVAFSNSPVVFGAFPSLHSACATMEALFLAHFFPQVASYAWGYAAVLYWATMYLTHHYLIDVVGGSCLAIAFFYFFLPDDLKGPLATASPTGALANGTAHINGHGNGRSKYEQYGLEEPHLEGDGLSYELSSDPGSDEENTGIAYRSPGATPSNPGSWETPTSAMPLIQPATKHPRRSHKHTASIASLIRADDRVEDGWSPIGNGSFVFPPAQTRSERDAR